MPRAAPTNDLERAIEVLNTWDTFAPDPEQIDGPEIFVRFLRWIGHPELADGVTGRDVEGFRALRGRLRAAFEADSESDAVAALNRILARASDRIRACAGRRRMAIPASGQSSEGRRGGTRPRMQHRAARGDPRPWLEPARDLLGGPVHVRLRRPVPQSVAPLLQRRLQ